MEECFAANVGDVKVASDGVPLSPVKAKTTKGSAWGSWPLTSGEAPGSDTLNTGSLNQRTRTKMKKFQSN